jgi:hypothetical protein
MKTLRPARDKRPVHSGPADHVVGQAAARTPGSGADDGPVGGDWLSEITEPAAPPPGVPIATRAKGDRNRGRAIESKRQRR